MVDWPAVVAVGGGGTVAAIVWGVEGTVAEVSPNPVGVEGSGGVCRLLSMGFGAGCGWDGGVEGEGTAGLVTTGGDSWDWLMSPHWISTSAGFEGCWGGAVWDCWHGGKVLGLLKLKGFLYC